MRDSEFIADVKDELIHLDDTEEEVTVCILFSRQRLTVTEALSETRAVSSQ